MKPVATRKTIRCLALGLAILICQACGGVEADPSAVKFKTEVMALLGKVERRVIKLVLQNEPWDRIGAALDGVFKDAMDAKKPLKAGLAVFNAQAIVMAARYPNLTGKGKPAKDNPGQNYSNYSVLRRVFENGDTISCLLYPAEGVLYTVCRPLKNGSKIAGAVCVGYTATLFKREFGLSKKKFLALSFPD